MNISLPDLVALPKAEVHVHLEGCFGLSEIIRLAAEELSRAAYRFSRRVSESGLLYADVIVNPTHGEPWRNRLATMLDAFDAGFAETEQDGLAPVGLCVSLLRQQSADEAREPCRTQL